LHEQGLPRSCKTAKSNHIGGTKKWGGNGRKRVENGKRNNLGPHTYGGGGEEFPDLYTDR